MWTALRVDRSDFGCRFDSFGCFIVLDVTAIAFAQINMNIDRTLGDRLHDDQFKGGNQPSHVSLFVYFQSCFEMKRSTQDDVVRRLRLKTLTRKCYLEYKNCVKISLVNILYAT